MKMRTKRRALAARRQGAARIDRLLDDAPSESSSERDPDAQ